uniref:Uncharacterized protein n=1 Tax=Phthorimaea operculella granulovirus TaxID=192584 RepID=A0A481SCY7_9BBAC|nr:hypothetical protein PhopGVgp123 [Phthorimaea operculella granulovirus]
MISDDDSDASTSGKSSSRRPSLTKIIKNSLKRKDSSKKKNMQLENLFSTLKIDDPPPPPSSSIPSPPPPRSSIPPSNPSQPSDPSPLSNSLVVDPNGAVNSKVLLEEPKKKDNILVKAYVINTSSDVYKTAEDLNSHFKNYFSSLRLLTIIYEDGSACVAFMHLCNLLTSVISDDRLLDVLCDLLYSMYKQWLPHLSNLYTMVVELNGANPTKEIMNIINQYNYIVVYSVINFETKEQLSEKLSKTGVPANKNANLNWDRIELQQNELTVLYDETLKSIPLTKCGSSPPDKVPKDVMYAENCLYTIPFIQTQREKILEMLYKTHV